MIRYRLMYMVIIQAQFSCSNFDLQDSDQTKDTIALRQVIHQFSEFNHHDSARIS